MCNNVIPVLKSAAAAAQYGLVPEVAPILSIKVEMLAEVCEPEEFHPETPSHVPLQALILSHGCIYLYNLGRSNRESDK